MRTENLNAYAAFWRARQILSGVVGISISLTPTNDNAFTTAFTNAGGAPTVTDSPAPLTPSGFVFVGTTCDDEL